MGLSNHILSSMLFCSVLLIGCSRSKFCETSIEESDIRIYQELTKILYNDSSLVSPEAMMSTIINDHKSRTDKLAIKPTSASKHSNLIIYNLKETKTWYMEEDKLLLMVSIDSSNRNFIWDDSDKEFGLNCQKLIDVNMMLRSITYYN